MDTCWFVPINGLGYRSCVKTTECVSWWCRWLGREGLMWSQHNMHVLEIVVRVTNSKSIISSLVKNFKKTIIWVCHALCTSTRASRRRKFPKNKWPIVRRKTCPDRVLPSTSGFFSTRNEAKSSHSALHTSHCTLRTPSFKLHTPHFTLHTPHFTLHSPHFTLLTSHCFLHTPNLTLHTSHFTLRSSHSKLKLHTLHFTLHIPHFTLLTSHCFLHTSHFTLHSSRPTLHTALNLRATKNTSAKMEKIC